MLLCKLVGDRKIINGEKKDICYCGMPVNKGDREQHVFIFCGLWCWLEKKKDICYCGMPVNRWVGEQHVFIFCGWFGDYRIKKIQATMYVVE